ncbi:type II secretion system F family protein [Proteiniclasticum sp. C24MP]|uniref:type II secretion system F family protein n=1 Tax=Proteiniclasticum sp. C24MP TaxID=3374101 RepID=UPI00375426A9
MNGIGLTEVLLISDEDSDRRLRECILAGMQLSEAMEEVDLFSSREISLIRLAEETGNLAGAFQSIHTSLKDQRELNSKIRTLLIYPLMLLVTAYVFLVCAVYFIVPPLYEMLQELGAENSFLGFIYSISREIPVYVVIALTAVLICHLVKMVKEKELIFRLVLGSQSSRYEEMIFIEELSLLSEGGLDLMESFRILREEGYPCDDLLTRIQNGAGLKEAFQYGDFSPGLLSYLTMAEETGNYSEAFASFVNLRKLYFKDYLKRKTALIEPAAIVIMGLLVFSVAYMIMIPMLGAYESL